MTTKEDVYVRGMGGGRTTGELSCGMERVVFTEGSIWVPMRDIYSSADEAGEAYDAIYGEED